MKADYILAILRHILIDDACSSFQTVCANFIRSFKKQTLVPLFCACAHKGCADSKGKKALMHIQCSCSFYQQLLKAGVLFPSRPCTFPIAFFSKSPAYHPFKMKKPPQIITLDNKLPIFSWFFLFLR